VVWLDDADAGEEEAISVKEDSRRKNTVLRREEDLREEDLKRDLREKKS
jgi:hypothetical protein